MLRAIQAEHNADFIARLLEGRGAETIVERNSAGLHARELAIKNNRQDIVAVLDKVYTPRHTVTLSLSRMGI